VLNYMALSMRNQEKKKSIRTEGEGLQGSTGRMEIDKSNLKMVSVGGGP
jgi:hypothetical protein